MKVLILWSDDVSTNLGVRVLAEGTASLARRAWGSDCDITHQSFGPNLEGFSPGRRAMVRDLFARSGSIKSWLREYDVVIDTGAGDSFTDIYGFKRFATMQYTQRAALRAGLPLVLGPQTIGPFDTHLGRLLARGTLRRGTLIAARDSASMSYAEQLAGVVPLHSTDVVFALPLPKPGPTRDVVLNVSGLLWKTNPHVDCGSYRRELRALVSALQSDGRIVTLMPHVLANPYHDDDEVVLAEVQAALGIEDVVVPIGLEHARETVAGAKVVIGSRMHACLNAISVGTPAVFLAYSRKFAPLLDDIGWKHGFDLRSDPSPGASAAALIADDRTDWSTDSVLEQAAQRLGHMVAALRRVPAAGALS